MEKLPYLTAKRIAGWLGFLLAAGPAMCSPVAVSVGGNFGAPAPGTSSILDNQAYSIEFLIPDPSLPDLMTCCAASGARASYYVHAQLRLPGLDLSLSNDLQVDYFQDDPVGQWMNIILFTDLPGGTFLVASPLQVNNGALWNGRAGSLVTPIINSLENAAGHGTFLLYSVDTRTVSGFPSAQYGGGSLALNFDVAAVPEPSSFALTTLCLLPLLRFARRASYRSSRQPL